MFIFLQL